MQWQRWNVSSYINRLAQREYKTRHDWVGKVIHWELCKRSKFDHADKWCMHKPESVQKNETHGILWDAEIQTEHSILARRPDLVLIRMKKSSCHQKTIEWKKNKQKRNNKKITWIFPEMKKLWNMKVIVLGTLPKSMEKRLVKLEIRGRIKTIQITALLRSAKK